MKVARTIADLRRTLAPERRAARTIGFVPTMGALHEGHLSLVRLARARTDVVVASIFVNPLQFGPAEDLARYPRDEASDLAKAEASGVDVVFVPGLEEMYPPGAATTVDVGPLGTIVEGAARPGHFNGVATVVAKLFNIVEPDVAFFGQKDAQQVAVIKQLVRDLDLDIEIVVGPTERDADGLALSSRNAYLSAVERQVGSTLHVALRAGEAAITSGDDPAIVEKAMWAVLADRDGIEPDYAVAVDPDTFMAPASFRPVLLAVAARVGTTRLIDNLLIER